MFFGIDIFLKTSNFGACYLLTLCLSLSTEFRVLIRDTYENDLRVIFDQWPKLNLGFDVEPEIRILKVIYIHTASLKCKFRNLFLFRRNKAPLLKYMYA